MAETENNMTSVERLCVFNSIPAEETLPPLQQDQHQYPSELKAAAASGKATAFTANAANAVNGANAASWPTRGAIEIRDLKLRYRPDLDLVVRGLSLSIPGGAKVGICGR